MLHVLSRVYNSVLDLAESGKLDHMANMVTVSSVFLPSASCIFSIERALSGSPSRGLFILFGYNITCEKGGFSELVAVSHGCEDSEVTKPWTYLDEVVHRTYLPY
jgi:hypothetical protein